MGRGWRPFAFQREVWECYGEGCSGLLHAPTGQGKTLAVWLGPVAEKVKHMGGLASTKQPEFTVLWLTPMRALAADTLRALQEPLQAVGLDWEVAARTGDTSANQRAKLRQRLPFALVTTPESLSLMLTYEDFQQRCQGLRAVVVDEWHELLGSKRGVQAELCLAKLRQWCPELRIWGLSATLGNLLQAAEVLLGDWAARADRVAMVSGKEEKSLQLDTLVPAEIERFPWAGHLGTRSLQAVIEALGKCGSTLLFTNTRSQTEIWYQSIWQACPQWREQLGMHHASVERDERQRVEQGLAAGKYRCVVCTSSLDLGVDFAPVEQVIQVGSPKGIARLMQRAGRSGHQPGVLSRVLCVPTNALELVEFAAAKQAIAERRVESRLPLLKPLDVLVQHLATLAIGSGVDPITSLAEVRSCYAFAGLTDEEWQWALGFISSGGEALKNYPQYQRCELSADGCYRLTNKRLIQLQRMSIGTITSEPSVSVRFQNGQRLGTVEEGFLSRIKIGGQFVFAGRRLQLLRFRNSIATVKLATKASKGQVATWVGTKMPLSSQLAEGVARCLAAEDGCGDQAELVAVRPILELQRAWSKMPQTDYLLVEQTLTREGENVFLFPFAGRLVHDGIGALLAYRLSVASGEDISVSVNDYGIGLSGRGGVWQTAEDWRQLLSADRLLDDLIECLNTAELAKRQFREIAQVSGLVLQGYPGKRKGMRDIQVSSSLLYEVFSRYDPKNLLLRQAQDEILERQLEMTRLRFTLLELGRRPIELVTTERLTPMAFPLWAERLQATIPAKDFHERLESMLEELERQGG